MSAVPLRFEGIYLNGTTGTPLSLDIGEHRCVSVVGDELSGIDRLGTFALGLERVRRGRVLIYGVDIATLARRDVLAFRRRVGYLPAGDGLLQNLSLRDNVALPLRFGGEYPEREIEGRLAILLGAGGIGDVSPLRPAQATDEQRRRAALVRALAFDPTLVLLEQPFDGLTNRAALEILELARGGDIDGGSRRTVMAVGYNLPAIVEKRFEERYRFTRGALQRLA